MKRLCEAASWFLSGTGIALLVASLVLVPTSAMFGQTGGGTCAGDDCDPYSNCFLSFEYTGHCNDGENNCNQLADPTNCKACHCVPYLNDPHNCKCKTS